MDTEKLGRIARTAAADAQAHGRRGLPTAAAGSGFEHVHSMVDDYSRLASPRFTTALTSCSCEHGPGPRVGRSSTSGARSSTSRRSSTTTRTTRRGRRGRRRVARRAGAAGVAAVARGALRAGALAAAVVGGVEARALEVDGGRAQDLVHRGGADLAGLERRVREALEGLELVTIRTAVLVDRHSRSLPYPFDRIGTRRLQVPMRLPPIPCRGRAHRHRHGLLLPAARRHNRARPWAGHAPDGPGARRDGRHREPDAPSEHRR